MDAEILQGVCGGRQVQEAAGIHGQAGQLTSRETAMHRIRDSPEVMREKASGKFRGREHGGTCGQTGLYVPLFYAQGCVWNFAAVAARALRGGQGRLRQYGKERQIL